jgi:hypothetical protein
MPKPLAVVTAVASMLVGCAGASDTAERPSAEIDREKELQRRLEVRQDAYKQLPESVPETSSPAILGEVPDSVLLAIKADLVDKLDADPDTIDVVTARAVTWNDGSLGCARPDQVYTQALVPGYQVILEYAGNKYDYRAAETGYFFLCELPTLPRRPEQL